MIKYLLVFALVLGGCCSPKKGPVADPGTPPVVSLPPQPPTIDPDCPPGEGLVLSKEYLVPTRSIGHEPVKIRKVITTHTEQVVVPFVVETYEIVHCPPGTSVVDFTPKELTLSLKRESPSYAVQSRVIDVVKLKKVSTTHNRTIDVELKTESFEVVK